MDRQSKQHRALFRDASNDDAPSIVSNAQLPPVQPGGISEPGRHRQNMDISTRTDASEAGCDGVAQEFVNVTIPRRQGDSCEDG